jgi:hypothetical protein
MGGRTGAVVGAGVGGAAGATVGKNVGETPAPQAARGGVVSVAGQGYDDDHRGRKDKKHKKNKHKKHRCDDEHPGKGHAYGKYKDCD